MAISNGSRIRLRAKRLSDAMDDYTWQTDPELAKHDASEVLAISYQQFLSEYTYELCYPTLNRHEFSIETMDGQHIGNCVYYNVNAAEGKTELGIMIGNRAFWNQGYGVEVTTALLRHIFSRTSLERVYLTTLEWNLRAQKCFRKCGFTDSSHLLRDGHSFLLMAIHREEFEKLVSAGQELPLNKKSPVE